MANETKQLITAKEVKALMGMELKYIYPAYQNSGEYWDRPSVRAYVAQADINIGLTVMGEHYDSRKETENEIICLNRADMNDTALYFHNLRKYMEIIKSGVHDRSAVEESALGLFGGGLNCAFG